MKTRIGKRRTGRLFKHGAGYAVAWTVNGERNFQSLRDKDGKPITIKKEAETARAELMAPYRAADEKAVIEHLAGKLATVTAEVERFDDERAPRLTIADAWQKYIAAHNRPDSGDATLRQYEFQWERFAAWMEARRPAAALRDVTDEDAAAYAADLSADLGPSTFNRHTGLLRLVFRVLAKTARIRSNPFADIGTKKAVQHSRRELTVEELARVCAAATGELRTLFAIGIYTGLRLGDCATLGWGDVDLIRGAIVRIPNKTARRNPKPVTIPLHPSLAGVLANTPEKKRRGYVLPVMSAGYRTNRCQVTDMVQKHFTDCGIVCHATGTGLVKVLDDEGKEKLKHSGKRAIVEVGFHSLRHSFVSLCRASGAPLSVVEAIVGHASPAMTRHYTHTGEAAARVSVNALPSVLGDAMERPALSAPADKTAATATPDALPGWAIDTVKRALLALDKGDVATVRKELETLLR